MNVISCHFFRWFSHHPINFIRFDLATNLIFFESRLQHGKNHSDDNFNTIYNSKEREIVVVFKKGGNIFLHTNFSRENSKKYFQSVRWLSIFTHKKCFDMKITSDFDTCVCDNCLTHVNEVNKMNHLWSNYNCKVAPVHR